MEEYFNGLLKEVDQRMATTAPGMDGKEVIGVCREMVSYLKGKNRELKEYALAHPFAGDAKEILYFKYYKPALTGRLLYYYRVYQIESGCPACLRVAEPYYRKAMERAERMMERYLPFYQYYHSGATYRDSYYFLRAKDELSPESGSFVLDEEAEFSTGYDILAARLISVEMLLVHLSPLEDKPGQLKKVAEVVSRCGSNVVSVQHDGSDPNMPISSCFLKLTLETRDAAQIEQIRTELTKAGFQLVSERV